MRPGAVLSWPVGVLLLLACVACSRASDSVADWPPRGVSLLNCTESAIVPMATGVLLNNMWNRRSAGEGAWGQCLQSRERAGGVDRGWTWHWPAKDGLYAYPELLVGRSPWTALASNDARFPRKLADIDSLRIAYEVESSFEGKKNLATEFWFTDADWPAGQSAPGAVKAELMIWTDYSDGMISPREKPLATVEIDGMTWNMTAHRGWGGEVGVAGPRWTFIVYTATKRTSSANFDAVKFFRDAIGRGLIRADDYLATVELGNEITSGTGSTWVKDFHVDMR